jgi:hypothetical protein
MTYKIEFTNKSKAPIFVKDTGYNNQTSMTMFGVATTDYGSTLWTNLLQYMEHYANTTPPDHSIEGQIWYDTATSTLKINKSKIVESPNWVPIAPKPVANTANLLLRTGGTLTYDLQLTDDITLDNQFATKEYADANANVTFESKNGKYQYNLMNFNGFITLNGTVQYQEFISGAGGNSVEITIPFEMKDSNYSVIVSVGSKSVTYTLANENPFGHHYYIVDKTPQSFSIHLQKPVDLPSDGEIYFCLVGLTSSTTL